MLSKDLVIQNEHGINIAAAQLLVNAMTKYSSSVILKVNDKAINSKSIISLMIAGIKKGTQVTVEANGKDEKAALAEVVSLIENGFEK